METIIKLIVDNSSYIVLLAYFIYKDYTFNKQVSQTLVELNTVLTRMKELFEK